MRFNGTAILLATVWLWSCNCGDRLTGRRGNLEAQPASVDFGVAAPSAAVHATTTLSNVGAGPLTVNDLKLDGVDAAAFSVVDLWEAFELAPGAKVVVDLTWSPTRMGVFSARLLVHCDAQNTPELAISLTGVAGPADDAGMDAGYDGGTDAGFDAGSDAGSDSGWPDAAVELPVFDGGGPCGASNVIDLPFLPVSGSVSRALTELAVGDGVFNVVWLEEDLDGGAPRIVFTRLTPAGSPVGPTRTIPVAAGRPRMASGILHVAWSGTQLGLVYALESSDGGLDERVGFQRIDATGAQVPGSEFTLATAWRVGIVGQGVAWNPQLREWGVAWGGYVNGAPSTTPVASFQRVSEAGAPLGTVTDEPNAVLEYWGAPLIAEGQGFSLATLGSVAPYSNAVRRIRYADGGTRIGVDDLFASWYLANQVSQANGAQTAGLVWSRLDVPTNKWVTQYGVVDLAGSPVTPTAGELASGDSVSPRLAWDGTNYVLVYTQGSPDGGYDIFETRFDESGAVAMPPRRLTCDGRSSYPNVAFNDGVHLVTYGHRQGVGYEVRQLLIK